MKIVPGNLSDEEMDARIEELQKKHAQGELEEDAYADPEDLQAKIQIEANPDGQPDAEKDEPKSADTAEDEPAKEPASDVAEPTEEPTSPEESKQDEPAKEPASEEEEFSTEGLTEQQANRVKAAQQRMHKATQEAAELKRKLEEKIEAAKETGEPQKLPKLELPEIQGLTKEQADKLAEDYPELAPAIKAIHAMSMQNEFLLSQLEKTNARVEQNEASTKETREAAKQRRLMEQLEAGDPENGVEPHPDAAKIQKSEEFYGWVDLQTDMIQQVIYEGGSPRDVSFVLSKYKADTGIETGSADVPAPESGDQPAPQPAKPSKLEQARKVASPNLPSAARQQKPGSNNPSGKKIFSLAEIDRIRKDPDRQDWLMSDEGDKWELEVIEAMRDGRIRD